MKTLILLVSVMFGMSLSGCATTSASADGPIATVASNESAREPGTMVVRRELVSVGSSDLLAPIPVPADAALVTDRTPGVAATSPSASRCENAPGRVQVANATEFPVTLTVDAEPLVVLGDGEIRRFIGPHTSVYLCLDPSRSHAFEGFALKPFGERLYAIPNSFRSEVAMGRDGSAAFTVSYELIAQGR